MNNYAEGIYDVFSNSKEDHGNFVSCGDST